MSVFTHSLIRSRTDLVDLLAVYPQLTTFYHDKMKYVAFYGSWLLQAFHYDYTYSAKITVAVR